MLGLTHPLARSSQSSDNYDSSDMMLLHLDSHKELVSLHVSAGFTVFEGYGMAIIVWFSSEDVWQCSSAAICIAPPLLNLLEEFHVQAKAVKVDCNWSETL